MNTNTLIPPDGIMVPDVTSALAPAAFGLAAMVAVLAVIVLVGRDGRRPGAETRARTQRPSPWLGLSTWAWPRRMTVALLLVLCATVAHAQGVADHLQCYKVTDVARKRLKGIVDLDAPSIGLAPGCKLAKGRLYCVPAKASVQPGTLLDGSAPLAELPYHGRPAETDRVCYEVSCPGSTGTAGDQTVTDRFGTRVLRRPTTEMVCTPATGGTLPPPANGFQIKSPPVDVMPGQNITYCYYFRTPNSVTVPVKRFVSDLGPGTHQVVAFTTSNAQGQPVDRFPPGTVSAVDCQMFAGTVVPRWLYEGDTASNELVLPADDGAGHPVAIEIAPNSSGFLMIHHVNTTAEVIRASVTLNAEALDAPIYTPTETYVAYSGDLSIPPQTTGHVESHACTVPAGVRFWRLSTHAHKQAVRTNVLDGLNVLFESLDWEHPGAQTWPAPPFHAFASSKLGYGCTYDNPSTRTITTGPSQQSDEQCIAVGYFFPATRPITCYDGFVLP